MKKRLLIIAAFALTMVGTSFAQKVNDYVYTATQRVKITGENLVVNGTFATKDGWTNALGEETNAEVWDFALNQGAGPNGENVLTSVSGGTADAAICNSWALESGSYIVMYDIKGDAYTPTGIINGGSSCADFFLTASGTLTKGTLATADADGDIQVATVEGFRPEWKTVSYFFETDGSKKLVMHFEKLAANTMVTNVRIFPAVLTYDDRILKNKLEYVDKLIATGKFTKDTENGFIQNVVGAIRPMLTEEGALDDISGVSELMAAYEVELQAWYDLNAADLLKDEKRWSTLGDTRKQNGMNEGKAGYNWKGTGGRWFHKNNGGSNEITDDGDEIGHRFQGGVEGNASQYYTITPANAGTYMFSLDIVGHYMAGGKSAKNLDPGVGDNYVTDWNRPFTGVTMFAGKDILGDNAETNATLDNEQEGQKIDCGNIANPNAKQNCQKFVVFYEVSQEMVDAKTPISFGITYILDPERTPTKMGSNVNIANPQIRLIGITQDVIDFQNEVAKIITQQGPLKERLDWAADDLAKTAESGYPYGKAALKEAADAAQLVYDASLNVIDAEGNVKDEAFIKSQMEAALLGTGIVYSDSLLHTVNAMNSARSAYNNANKLTSTTYPQKIADAEAVLADPFYGAGDKATFTAAIDAAKAKLVEILAIANDENKVASDSTLNSHIAILAEAVEAYKVSANNLPIIDIDFSTGFVATEDGHKIVGNKGEMFFTNANPEANNVDKEMSYALGCGEEKLDVLRIGSADSWVNVAEADQAGAEDIIRFEFDIWGNRLSGKSIWVDLRNASDQRVAGFKFNPYDSATGYNDFDNEAHEGMYLQLNKSFNAGTAGDVASVVDAYKTHFTLMVDYKAQAVQGITVTTNGTLTGALIPLRKDLGDGSDTQEATPLEDNKVAKFVLGSDYATFQGRRCWFDNLKAYKYASQADGPISGITGVKAAVKADGAIYNLAGQKVDKSYKGLVIMNGKKVVLK